MFLAYLIPHLHFITGCGNTQFFFFFFLLYFVFGTIESELWRLSKKLVQVRAMTFWPVSIFLCCLEWDIRAMKRFSVLFCSVGRFGGIFWLFLELVWVF